MQAAFRDRVALEMDLSDALVRHEFFLVYQPIFDRRSESMSGVEALIRWEHPTRGKLGPEEFVPLAEENGDDRSDRPLGVARGVPSKRRPTQ